MGSSKVPAKEQKACSNGASGENWEEDRRTTASKLATTDTRAIARAFRTTMKPRGTEMLLTEAFPIRGTSAPSRGLPRPRLRHRNADGEQSEKLSDGAKL